MKHKGAELDDFDRKLIRLLTQDGRMSSGKAAQSLRVTSPTVRARLEALVRTGVLRIVALLDLSRASQFNIALIGISLERHQQLDRKLEQISNLRQVHWAAAVTGRFDLIVEIILENDMPDLYRFQSVDLLRVGGIRSSESFMVMKAKRKWILLPESDGKAKQKV